MVIGIVAGPIIEPVQKALQLYPQDEEEEDVVANVDIPSISDPVRYTLRTVLMQQDQFDKVTSTLEELAATITTMKKDIGMLKSAQGLVDEERETLSKKASVRKLKSSRSVLSLTSKSLPPKEKKSPAASAPTKTISSSTSATKMH